MNKSKPDDRRDNVDKIQRNIDNTIANYRETEDMIRNSVSNKQKNDLQEKNERREQSIKNMRREIKDEALDKRNGNIK
ncbi:small acid-soluble spore protein Tlp [Sedimentibacter hydroxybenzoicus DSM 7310]|uniref:Small acid-soluble spore protein Tlp n=1 Tax=Sedimentibacter hydroxybenzoicus DSM 7310 TaxID=1123245 RepID=A0A974GW56_SEDHY|nr:small acid-soluble spore protein Tlp [Sedimentibacter hydroxybenzoicus]NYB73971.1 small acid-soluble spore protein Tlp [Sedimentibacter hydroxybenzoicus DSM 7310]